MGKLNTTGMDDDSAGAFVEGALKSLPLAPTPPGFTSRVMFQVRALAPRPRFRLTWLDYAVSIFGAAMSGVIVWVVQSFPPELSLLLRIQITLSIHQLSLMLLR